MKLAKYRNVVETRIGPRVRDHYQSVSNQDSAAIGHVLPVPWKPSARIERPGRRHLISLRTAPRQSPGAWLGRAAGDVADAALAYTNSSGNLTRLGGGRCFPDRLWPVIASRRNYFPVPEA